MIVMNESLRMLDRSGVKVVSYIDYLVILLLGMFSSVISEIMEGTLGKVCLCWKMRIRYKFNQNGTDYDDKGARILTKWTKIATFPQL